MRMHDVGDSYDIVRCFQLHIVEHEGGWAARPLFSEPVTPEAMAHDEACLGACVLRLGVRHPAVRW
jgi:hypothetical protein